MYALVDVLILPSAPYGAKEKYARKYFAIVVYQLLIFTTSIDNANKQNLGGIFGTNSTKSCYRY